MKSSDYDLDAMLDTYRVPVPDPSAQAATAALLRRTAQIPPPMTSLQFLRAQAGFIKKSMWALQLAFLAAVALLAVAAMREGMGNRQLCNLFSAAAPLIILINVTDFARIYNGGMLELELATRFSLPKVVAARLLLFGLTDSFILIAAAAIMAATVRAGLLELLLHGFVPFNCMCAGCLAALRRLKPDQFAAAAVLLAAVLVGTMAAGQTLLYGIMREELWLAALLISAAAVLCQSRAFVRGRHLAEALPQ